MGFGEGASQRLQEHAEHFSLKEHDRPGKGVSEREGKRAAPGNRRTATAESQRWETGEGEP